MTLQRAGEVLRPYVPDLLRSLFDAMNDWNGGLAPYQVAMDAIARAVILNRLFYHHAGRHLAGSDVQFGEHRLQKYLAFDEAVIVRAKLLDSRLEARNYPTEQATEWVQQLPLPGIPPVSRLHFGYRLDITGTTIKDVCLALPNGNPTVVNDWVWQVYGEPIRAFGFQQPLFGREVFRYEDFKQTI